MTHDFTHRTLSRKFVLQRRIGIGGMATVYEATNLHVDDRVAIKILNPEFVTHDTLLPRFRQEARSAIKLKHQNIVQVQDFDVDGDLPYIVMEYLEGCSLSELLRGNAAPLPWRRVASMSAQVCAALHHAHSRGLLHRDIKPSNVFLVADPEHGGDLIKLLDFGIAKVTQLQPGDPEPLTRPSQVPGTPEYMAPEQATGHECDARTDLYAVGVMMYRLLTGQLPFFAATATETLAQHVLRAPTPPRETAPEVDIPPELEAIVLRALAKVPGERWESALALRDALLALVGDVRQQPPPRGPRPAYATMSTRSIDALPTPGWTTLHDFEWRDMLLRRRRFAAAFSGVSLGLGAFMFFSLFPLPGAALLAGAPEPPTIVDSKPPEWPRQPPPILPERLSPPTTTTTPPDNELIVLDESPIPPPTGESAPGSAPDTSAIVVPVPLARPRPPPDPTTTIATFLKRKRSSFEKCRKLVPFSELGETATLRVNLTLEPSTGRALTAVVAGKSSAEDHAICAVQVLRDLTYPRYVGPNQLDGIEFTL